MLYDSLSIKYLQQSVHRDSVTTAFEFEGRERSPCLMHYIVSVWDEIVPEMDSDSGCTMTEMHLM